MTLSLEIREKVIELRKAGYIDAAISRMVGVAHGSVRKICDAAGVAKPEGERQLGRRRKHFYSEEQGQEIVLLRVQGYVVRVIAEKLGLSENSVNHACYKAGLRGVIGHLGRKLPPDSSKYERNEELRELRRQGLTLQKIANQHGITRERVRQLCVGVERPDIRVRKNCGTCGVEFIPNALFKTGYTSTKYCSRECGKKGMTASMIRQKRKESG
jgi:DNA-binding CsgD family transcriptional regulator